MKRLAAVLVFLSLLASACGEDPPAAYTNETEANFMASCAGPGPEAGDPGDVEAAKAVRIGRIHNDICTCVFENTKSSLNYTRFAEYDAQLKTDLTRDLQAIVTSIVADCVTEEVEL